MDGNLRHLRVQCKASALKMGNIVLSNQAEPPLPTADMHNVPVNCSEPWRYFLVICIVNHNRLNNKLDL